MNKYTSGIYCITNTQNGKVYIGQSVQIERRKHQHWWCLRRGGGSTHLQRAWDKCGETAFVFSIIEVCPRGCLNERENFWIAKLKTFDQEFGYNLDRVAHGTGERTIETRKAISEGKKKSGYRHSQETKERISKAKRGVPLGPCSEERKEKHSKAMLGKRLSEEHKRKLSEAKLGKPGNRTGTTQSAEARLKMSKAKLGKPSGRKGCKRIVENGKIKYIKPHE